jgi:hypothetical protein
MKRSVEVSKKTEEIKRKRSQEMAAKLQKLRRKMAEALLVFPRSDMV